MPPCLSCPRMLAFFSFFIAFTTALPISTSSNETGAAHLDAGSEDVRQTAHGAGNELFHHLHRSTLAPEALTIAFFLLLTVLFFALAAALPKLCTLLISVVARARSSREQRTDATLERWRVEREVSICEQHLTLRAQGLLPLPPPPYTPRPPPYSDSGRSGKAALPPSDPPTTSQGGDAEGLQL